MSLRERIDWTLLILQVKFEEMDIMFLTEQSDDFCRDY